MTRKKKTKPNLKDPYASREAEKYEHPIPSREFLLEHLEKQSSPVSSEDLANELGLILNREQLALEKRLKAMVRDGQLLRNRRGHYASIARCNLIKGRVIGHKEGYGFFVPEGGGEQGCRAGPRVDMGSHGTKVKWGWSLVVAAAEEKWRTS